MCSQDLLTTDSEFPEIGAVLPGIANTSFIQCQLATDDVPSVACLLNVLIHLQAEDGGLPSDLGVCPCPVREDPIAVEAEEELLLVLRVLDDAGRRTLPGFQAVRSR